MPNQIKENAISFEQAFPLSAHLRGALNAQKKILDFVLRKGNPLHRSLLRSHRKDANEFMDYQIPEPMLLRSLQHDRVFPMETVELQRFNRDYDADIDTAIIHTGAYADELARSMNALAITIAHDIYFRNSAYNLSNEKGKKILAHELTHVQQFTEHRINANISDKELEEEAEISEKKETDSLNEVIPVAVGNSIYTVTRNEFKRLGKTIAYNIKSWIEHQKDIMDEREYLGLLLGVERWLKGV